MLNGFSRSGKTTLANKIIRALPELTKIDSDSILDFLNRTYPIYQDDNSIDGTAYKIRQETTKGIQLSIASTLLRSNKSVLIDACHARRDIRNEVLKNIKKIDSNITTIIIRHKINEEELYKNIARADKESEGSIWKDLYEKV